MVIYIPVSRIAEFEKLVTKFQKKQLKYGQTVGFYEYLDEVNKDGYLYKKINLMNFCEIIRKDDADEYLFCGITHNNNNGIIQNYIEDDCFLEYFKEYPEVCDHCNSKRNRNSYYVFEHNENAVYIGSTCVKDYFGINAVEALSFREKLLKLRYLVQKQDKVLTFDEVAYFINENIAKKWQDIKDDYGTIEELFDKGGKILTGFYDKVKDYYKDCRTQFEQNCYNALQKDVVSSSNWRIYFCAVYYAMIAFNKRNKNNTIQKVVSNYKIGDKITRDVKVIFTKDYTNQYGYKNYVTSRFIKMIDKVTGEILTTSTSGILKNVCIGDEITITGTVIDKKDFKGQESWSLTRCK